MFEVTTHGRTTAVTNYTNWQKEVVQHKFKKSLSARTKTKEELEEEAALIPLFNEAWKNGSFFIELHRDDSVELISGIVATWEEVKILNGVFAGIINCSEDNDNLELDDLTECSIKIICNENDMNPDGNRVVKHFRFHDKLIKNMGDLWTLFELNQNINDGSNVDATLRDNYTIIHA